MRYVRGDHHGLATHLLEVAPAMGRREDFLKYLAGDPPDGVFSPRSPRGDGFDPARRTRRAVGPFTVRVPAPPGSAIAWFSAGGSFVTHQGADAPKTANTMAYASGEPRGFRTFYRSAVPEGNDHWHYNADVEVKLDQPAKDLFIRYLGDPGVNAVRVYAHCLRERPCASSPVEIRHAFREKGVLLERTFRLEGAESAYDLDAEEPDDEWVEISVPSVKR